MKTWLRLTHFQYQVQYAKHHLSAECYQRQWQVLIFINTVSQSINIRTFWSVVVLSWKKNPHYIQSTYIIAIKWITLKIKDSFLIQNAHLKNWTGWRSVTWNYNLWFFVVVYTEGQPKSIRILESSRKWLHSSWDRPIFFFSSILNISYYVSGLKCENLFWIINSIKCKLCASDSIPVLSSRHSEPWSINLPIST